MTSRWCRGCRGFFDKKHATCPHCGTVPHAFNAGLASSRWESALNAKAAAASREA